MRTNSSIATWQKLGLLLFSSCLWFPSCQRYGQVGIQEADPGASPPQPPGESTKKLDPIERYGGHVLTATGMPSSKAPAYLWAKNTGTLVAYETFLRHWPDGGEADFFRRQIREKFVPREEEWQDAWRYFSQIETISGATVHPVEGFILFGQPRTGRMSPFFYEDLIGTMDALRERV